MGKASEPAFADTFLYEKQKMYAESYSLGGSFESFLASLMCWEDTSMSSPELLWMPRSMLPVTSQGLLLHRSTSWVTRGRICQQHHVKQSIFRWQFCSLCSGCPFISKGKKNIYFLGKCDCLILHHRAGEADNYSLNRDALCSDALR